MMILVIFLCDSCKISILYILDDDDVVHTPVEYVIEGVPIKFPFEAYQCQREMLERVL